MNISIMNNNVSSETISVMQGVASQCNDISYSCKESCIAQCTNHILETALNGSIIFLLLGIGAMTIYMILYLNRDAILPNYNKYGIQVTMADFERTLFYIFAIGFVLITIYMILVRRNIVVFG